MRTYTITVFVDEVMEAPSRPYPEPQAEQNYVQKINEILTNDERHLHVTNKTLGHTLFPNTSAYT